MTSSNQSFSAKEQQIISRLTGAPYGVAYKDMMQSTNGDCFMVFAVKDNGKLKFVAAEQIYDESAQGNFPKGTEQFDNVTYLFSVYSRRLAKINEALGNYMTQEISNDIERLTKRTHDEYRLKKDTDFKVGKDGLIYC